jgi:plasmid stabilization system protein ParE
MLAVDYHPAARRDFDESFDWYLERSPRSAVRFTEAIDNAIAIIAANPERFRNIDPVHRECPLHRFPFRIIYRVIANRVYVVAIAHGKRKPGYWKGR